MFPADVLRDTEEHVFVEWLCIVAKMWGNDSPNAREKVWLRTWVKSTKEGGVAARADTRKVSVKEGEESAEKGAEEINSDKSSMATALLFVGRPESWSIRTKAVDRQKKTNERYQRLNLSRWKNQRGRRKRPGRRAVTPHNAASTRSKYRQERIRRRAHGIPTHAHMQKPLTIRERWHFLFLTPLYCIEPHLTSYFLP